ncbi:hypothetical protein [Roseateles sp. MS654]|uniref:hypothetical protein n=1 Tax=Roseateles sp. MS654 TaxID=3412685 RepID=UPI003C2C70CE
MTKDSSEIRRAIIEAADSLDQAQAVGQQPPGFTYVPPTHARALDLEATLVEGMRGAGKSFWWSSLVSQQHRSFIHIGFPEARFPDEVIVRQGFGAGSANPQYPDAEQLIDLVRQYRPRSVWRAVVAFHAGFQGQFSTLKTWSQRVNWVQTNSEQFALELDALDRQLEERGSKLLVLFDALDRLADDWHHIRPLARGLLQVALDMRSTRNLRCKIYLRPDMLEDDEIVSFPDFSKLNATKASLRWQRADLYALLFQCLGNASRGADAFRRLTATVSGVHTSPVAHGGWVLPNVLRIDEDLQEKVFEHLAGNAMGSSTKRGKPYTWLVNHLQDGRNQVSPRSFFAALRTAANEQPEGEELPIGYRGIQRGVQEASIIRVTEITEDYPWVRLIMQPLSGNLTVPCTVRDIEAAWKRERTLEALQATVQKQGEAAKLPPQHLEQGVPGIIVDLEGLGMLNRLDGKRVQMPDVYRVAFGLGRRGGVKPLK